MDLPPRSKAKASMKALEVQQTVFISVAAVVYDLVDLQDVLLSVYVRNATHTVSLLC
jgi:hypothetical protein